LDEEEQSKKSFGSEEVDVSVFIDVEKDITLTFGVYNFSYIINFNWLESIHFIILQSRGILHALKNPQVGKIHTVRHDTSFPAGVIYWCSMRLHLALLSLLGIVSAIYPEDHWKYSQKLTVGGFDQAIKEAVDADKTMFVRWIASAGWGWWRKQAPAWNSIVRRYADHPGITFGDVNLSEENIRGNHQPGSGGWPTIRYFNKETGYDGASYVKKTSKSVCDELGEDSYMEDYVIEAAGVASCVPQSGEGCSEKEKEFISKWSSQDSSSLLKEENRLNGMNAQKLKPDLALWLKQRKAIIKQLLRDRPQEL
jgi:hypothetical protein